MLDRSARMLILTPNQRMGMPVAKANGCVILIVPHFVAFICWIKLAISPRPRPIHQVRKVADEVANKKPLFEVEDPSLNSDQDSNKEVEIEIIGQRRFPTTAPPGARDVRATELSSLDKSLMAGALRAQKRYAGVVSDRSSKQHLT